MIVIVALIVNSPCCVFGKGTEIRRKHVIVTVSLDNTGNDSPHEVVLELLATKSTDCFAY